MQNAFKLKLLTGFRSRILMSFNLRSLALRLAPAAMACSAAAACSGCFSMGLVENYAPLVSAAARQERLPAAAAPSRESTRSRILLIAPPAETAEHETLGHQYILGILPVTSLYVEQGSRDFAREAILEQLQLEGHDVLTAPPESAALALELFRPNHIIEPEINHLSASAYDVFLLRIASASADVRYSLLRPDSSGAITVSASLPIAENRRLIKKTARAPLLSALLDDVVRQTVTELLQNPVFAAAARRKRSIAAASDELLPVIAPPRLRSGLDLEMLRSTLAASYGFETVPAFSREEVLRIVQRGLAQGIESALGKSPAAALQPPASFANNTVRWWNIDAEITEAQIVQTGRPRLLLNAMISVTEFSPAAPAGELLWRRRCRVSAPRRDELDGYWVHSLQDAAAAAAVAAVSGTALSGACSPGLPAKERAA